MPLALISRVTPGSSLIETGSCVTVLALRLCCSTWLVFELSTNDPINEIELGYARPPRLPMSGA